MARIPLIGRFVDAFNASPCATRRSPPTSTASSNSLERARMALLKDVTVLDKMYELNLEYLRSSTSTSPPATRSSRSCTDQELPALEVEARASQDPMVAQQLTDFRNAIARFERRLHDLKLTRMIAIQTAPQIRLIQNNDQNLVEKIQSSILNTDPAVEEPDHHRHQPLPPAAGPRAAEGGHRHGQRAAGQERRAAQDGLGQGGARGRARHRRPRDAARRSTTT